MPIIGLDIGTTGCKAILFTEDGKILSSASREYDIDIPHPGWAEQDAEMVWELAQDALGQAIYVAGNPAVQALGLSVQGEAVIPVTEEGKALRPAILGMDTRTGRQNEWLATHLGAQEIFTRTGMPIHTINTLPKLLWLRENEPAVWKSARFFYLYEDFIVQKCCGQSAISQCLASRTQLFDIHQMRWSTPELEALDLAPEKLSPILPSGYPVAQMKPELAKSIGLPNQPLVTTGGHDQACGALGVGLTRPGLAMVSTGTAEVVEIVLGQPVMNDTIFKANLSCYCHVLPEQYLIMTLNHSGGLLLRWFRDTFCLEEVREAKQKQSDAYDLILGDPKDTRLAGPGSLLLLPHFAGSGTPTFDTASRGSLIGMSFSTTKRDVAHAIIEGLTYELNGNLELLQSGGVSIEELRAIGGGARSDLWLQLKADVTGILVLRPAVTEAACWGAALLAAQGAGLFADAARAAETSVTFTDRFQPNSDRTIAFKERFQLYQQLYPLLKQIHARL